VSERWRSCTWAGSARPPTAPEDLYDRPRATSKRFADVSTRPPRTPEQATARQSDNPHGDVPSAIDPPRGLPFPPPLAPRPRR